MTGRQIMAGAGRIMITLGVVALLFFAYQLWGTGIAESHSQDALRRQLAGHEGQVNPDAVPPVSGSSPDTSASTATTGSAGRPTATRQGSPEGVVKIPKIGVNQVFVEGTDTADLRRGPGHYVGTVLPGQPGNAALAGHRTTYGGPFYHLDELRRGDKIIVATAWGTFWYDVRRSWVVDPSDVAVIAPTANSELTLTTCTPRFSASRRLIVQADLAGPPASASLVSQGPAQAASSAGGSDRGWLPVTGWGLAAMAVAVSASRLARRRRHRWGVYLLSAPPFLAVLFMFFVALSVMLPDTI